MLLMEGERLTKHDQSAQDKYEQSVEAYQKAVNLNGMHIGSWFSLGYVSILYAENKSLFLFFILICFSFLFVFHSLYVFSLSLLPL